MCLVPCRQSPEELAREENGDSVDSVPATTAEGGGREGRKERQAAHPPLLSTPQKVGEHGEGEARREEW